MTVRSCAFLLGLFAGCGDRAAHRDGADAGPDGGPEFEPTAPESPRTTPCPDGWRAEADPDAPEVVVCDPWPEGGREDCADDEAHFPGTPGCAPIGSTCPAGDFAEGLPASGVVYVRAGEPAGGDGTRAAPFARIAEAVAAADDGDTIALSKGTFDEAVTLSRPVTLQGACVAETIVASSSPSEIASTLTLTRHGAEVHDLEVSGARAGIGIQGSDVPAFLESVLVRAASGAGVVVFYGGDVVASRLVVRDTGPGAYGDMGMGLQLDSGGHAEIAQAVFERNRAESIIAIDPDTSLVANDLAVRETAARDSDGYIGHGLQIDGGATVTLGRAVFETGTEVGVALWDVGTRLVATDLVVADTRGDRAGDFGFGMQIAGGASADVQRATFQGNRGVQVVVADPGSSLSARDVVIRDALSRDLGTIGGHGLDVHGGASVQIDRAAFERNRGTAVLVAEDGTVLLASDLSVGDTRASEATRERGYGLDVYGGATTGVSRASFRRDRSAAIVVSDPGTAATFEDLVVESTLPQECVDDGCPGGGDGIASVDGARVEVTRFRVSGNALCGVLLARDGEMDLHDGRIVDHPTAANVQTDGFDPTRLEDGVTYENNETNLDSVALPVPDSEATLPD